MYNGTFVGVVCSKVLTTRVGMAVAVDVGGGANEGGGDDADAADDNDKDDDDGGVTEATN